MTPEVSRPRHVVVGAAGTLGTVLVRELGLPGVELRGGEEAAGLAAVSVADAVVNVGGPRVRPELRGADYEREHVAVVRAIAGAMKPGAHLVHVSSTAVFGAQPGAFLRVGDEAPGTFPMPEYAAAKLAAERLAVRAAAERGLGLTVLRPAMVYGAGVDSMVATLMRLAHRGADLTPLAGPARQHLTHVDLFVAAVRAALGRGPSGATPLTVADPFVFTTRDIADAARRGGARAVPVPLPLGALTRAHSLARALLRDRVPGSLAALAVLAMDNEYDVRPAFVALGLNAGDFARAGVFMRGMA